LTSTGDGVVAALQVLKVMVQSGSSLEELTEAITKFPQVMVNVHIKEKVAIHEYPEIIAAIADAESRLAGRGRVLLRPSGTEPLIRVMVEGEDQALVQSLVESLAGKVEKLLS
jgi:phosphoglucosamine mutase